MTTTVPLDATASFAVTQASERKPPRQRKASPTPPVLLTVEHTCARYGMSRSYLYRLIGDGLVATRKLGRRILIARAEQDLAEVIGRRAAEPEPTELSPATTWTCSRVRFTLLSGTDIAAANS
jgi:predicted DNA-binding transcriptional regulator AlpA